MSFYITVLVCYLMQSLLLRSVDKFVREWLSTHWANSVLGQESSINVLKKARYINNKKNVLGEKSKH